VGRFGAFFSGTLRGGDFSVLANVLGDDLRRGESLVTELIEKFHQVQLPPHQERELGLQSNWKDAVTKEFAEKVFDAAQKHRDAIRELGTR
jgi:hypothetical protein